MKTLNEKEMIVKTKSIEPGTQKLKKGEPCKKEYPGFTKR